MKKIVWLAVVGIVACLGVSLMVVLQKWSVVEEAKFEYSEKALNNPLMGFAPDATQDVDRSNVSLLYVDVTWAELEPEQGKYQFEQIEEENYFEQWKQEGKHLVFRFLLDQPGDESHKDIPDWLYEKMEDPGDWYTSTYGSGFSPNYADGDLREAYDKAVQAMAERWGGDGFLAYIEMGALGHWGEWHVDQTAGVRSLPSQTVRESYVEPWIEGFPKAKILMRRPFSVAAEQQLGLYNDVFGESESTQTWLDWIENGGTYDETGDENLVAMSGIWQLAPLGGELTSSIYSSDLEGELLERTLVQVREAHLTFLGPKVVEETSSAYNRLLENMGYRLWISQARLEERGNRYRVVMTWENAGLAPMYQDWDVNLKVVRDGVVVQTVKVPLQLSQITAGVSQDVIVEIGALQKLEGQEESYSLYLEIENPLTVQAGVALAIQGQEENRSVLLIER